MLELNDGYNTLELEIKNYENKFYRKINRIDEDDSWCNIKINVKNEYINLENPYCSLECIEIDMLYELLDNFVKDKIDDNCSFEPIEPMFRLYFYPFGREFKNKNYVQDNLSRNDKLLVIFVAFIEKDTNALLDDGIIINLDSESVMKLLKYLSDIKHGELK